MQDSLYVTLSAQVALENRLTTVANNVANMGTSGYRADGITFETLVQQAGENPVAFVGSGTNFISRDIGATSKTDNPLDVAIQGEGWLGIKTPQGTAYTRDGRMQIAASGQLQTLNGYPVLDAGGTGMLVDPNGGAPTIAADGMITQGGRQVGAIGLFQIDQTANLARTDNSGVIPDKPATAILDFSSNGVLQGYVEGSNVNPILEMTKLISIQHAFDNVTQMTTTNETSFQDAIKTLGSSD